GRGAAPPPRPAGPPAPALRPLAPRPPPLGRDRPRDRPGPRAAPGAGAGRFGIGEEDLLGSRGGRGPGAPPAARAAPPRAAGRDQKYTMKCLRGVSRPLRSF